jgi:hypothetical protein
VQALAKQFPPFFNREVQVRVATSCLSLKQLIYFDEKKGEVHDEECNKDILKNIRQVEK